MGATRLALIRIRCQWLELPESWAGPHDGALRSQCVSTTTQQFAYTHVASEAGIDLTPRTAVRSWIARIAAHPGFIDDYVRYPENARPGRGHSIYDES